MEEKLEITKFWHACEWIRDLMTLQYLEILLQIWETGHICLGGKNIHLYTSNHTLLKQFSYILFSIYFEEKHMLQYTFDFYLKKHFYMV